MARPKGSRNKTTATAKENVIAVFTRLGGTAEMARWAKDNLTEFYRLYARLIPTAVEGKIDVEHKVPVPSESDLAQRLAAAVAARTQAESPAVRLDS